VGRVDDIINTAGHRLSTSALEEVLMDHPEVAEYAVFSVHDKFTLELPVGIVVTNKGSTMEETQLLEESENANLYRISAHPESHTRSVDR
jgi:propionyl-CoA synthetase